MKSADWASNTTIRFFAAVVTLTVWLLLGYIGVKMDAEVSYWLLVSLGIALATLSLALSKNQPGLTNLLIRILIVPGLALMVGVSALIVVTTRGEPPAVKSVSSYRAENLAVLQAAQVDDLIVICDDKGTSPTMASPAILLFRGELNQKHFIGTFIRSRSVPPHGLLRVDDFDTCPLRRIEKGSEEYNKAFFGVFLWNPQK